MRGRGRERRVFNLPKDTGNAHQGSTFSLHVSLEMCQEQVREVAEEEHKTKEVP